MNNKAFHLVLVMVLGSLCFWSCKKVDQLNDVENGSYDAEFAIPLFHSKTTLKSLLENINDSTFVTVDPDGLLNLNYKGNVVSRSSEDVIQFFTGGIIPIPTPTYTIAYDLPDSLFINVVNFKAGTLFVAFESLHEEDMEVTFRIPQLNKDGVVFEKEWYVDYNGDPGILPIQELGAYDLTGYEITSEDNTILIEYEAYHPDGTQDTMTTVTMLFANFEFSYAEGFLGSDIYEIGKDTIEIDFFENWITGDIYFVDPQVLITIDNSFGFPVRSVIHSMDVLTVDSLLLPVESQYIDNLGEGVFFNYPSFSEIGETKHTVFSFNNTNSNIDDVLGSGPLALYYDIDALGNPNANADNTGYLTCESELTVQVEVVLPIWGSATNFAAFDTIKVDTIDLDVDLNGYGEADWAEFKLVSDNGLPLDIYLQAYFMDENDIIIDSLLNGQEVIMAAAPVDSEGVVTEVNQKITYIYVTAERFENIKKAKSVFLNTLFYSTNNGSMPVKVLATDAVDIRMGVKFGISN